MTDTTFNRIVLAVCGLTAIAVLYIQRRYLFAPPDFKVTRRMLEQAEMNALFGDDYVWDDEMDDEEEV